MWGNVLFRGAVSGALVVSLLSAPVQAAGKKKLPFAGSAELLYINDDNLTQAEASNNIVEDDSVMLNATISLDKVYSLRRVVGVHAFAETQAWSEISSLNRTAYGLRADMRMTPKLSFTAPIYQVSAEISNQDFDSDIRDATKTKIQFFATKPLTQTIRGTLGIDHENNDSDGLAFDTTISRFFAHADLAIDDSWGVYGSYSFSTGDFVSSAQQRLCDGSLATGLLPLVSQADEIEPDAALNDELCGDWLAYKIDADANVFKTGVRKSFGNKISTDFSVLFADIEAEDSVGYERMIFNAAVLMRL